MSFNFMVAITICSEFAAQKNKVCHCFHCFTIYFLWNDGTRCHDPSFLNVELKANFFILLFHFHQEELRSLLMRVKQENEKTGLKLNILKTKIMSSGPITSWQIDGKTMEIVTNFIFLDFKITADADCSHELKLDCSL